MNALTHIDLEDPRYREAAGQILSRHEALQPEANITSAVRDFLTATGLARSEEIIEENPPSDGSRRAVDLTQIHAETTATSPVCRKHGAPADAGGYCRPCADEMLVRSFRPFTGGRRKKGNRQQI